MTAPGSDLRRRALCPSMVSARNLRKTPRRSTSGGIAVARPGGDGGDMTPPPASPPHPDGPLEVIHPRRETPAGGPPARPPPAPAGPPPPPPPPPRPPP